MGTATTYPLSDSSHDVRLVGTHLDGEIIERCKEHTILLLKKAAEGVRSFFVDELGEAMKAPASSER
jgi:hypothetical protein